MGTGIARWLTCLLLVGTATPMFGCTKHSRTLRIFDKDFPKVPHLPGVGVVEGSDCGGGALLFIRLGRNPSFVDAVEDALEKAGPEFNALADVTARYEDKHYVGYGWNCIYITGRPVRIGIDSVPEWMHPAQRVPEGTKPADWNF